MSCDQRLCPGVGGRRCGVFMSPLFRDPHPTCARCMGVKGTSDVTCDICKDWSVAQWETFLKRRRKKRPSVSALPSAPPILLPSASAPSGDGGCPSRGFSRGGRGSAERASVFAGASDSAASSLPGVRVAGSSCSQESFVLADPSPVDSSVSAEGDRRSPSREIGGSTGDCYCSCSSHSSPSRGRDDREECRCARPRSRGSRALFRESCSHSTERLQSCGRKCSRCDSSRSPSALVWARLSRLWSSDCYRERRLRLRSRSDRSRSRQLRSSSTGRREAWRDRGSRYRSRDRRQSCDRSRSGKRSWWPGRSCRDREVAIVASHNRGNSGSTVEPAPSVAGGSIPLPTSSFRLFLSLSGPVAQRDAAVGSLLSVAGVTGTGVLPGPTTPVTPAAPVACLSAMPAPGVSTPAGAASATALPSQCECAWESSAQRGAAGARLVGKGPVRVGSVARVSPLPLLALPVLPVCLPPLFPSPQMQKRGLVRCLLPPLDDLA